MKIKYPCVTTIAGTDPSGGAGIQADIKTISAIGCYAASVITALVAQNTQGVQSIMAVPPDFVSQQIESVFSDLDVSVVKIGMLHNENIINVVADALKKLKAAHVVVDPVMVAKNGCALLLPEVITSLKESLFPCATMITPNLFEAEKLSEMKIETMDEMECAAQQLGKEFNIDVLIKGGHLNSGQSSDVLYLIEYDAFYWFHAERIDTKNTHGTGCSLSSAIASYLALGHSKYKAVEFAKKYITNAIRSGKDLQIGRGYGPINHFYFLENINDDVCKNV